MVQLEQGKQQGQWSEMRAVWWGHTEPLLVQHFRTQCIPLKDMGTSRKGADAGRDLSCTVKVPPASHVEDSPQGVLTH